MPTWRPPTSDDPHETWKWVNDHGRVLATVYREGDRWVVSTRQMGRIGTAPDRRRATAMLVYDRRLGMAMESDARRRQRGAAERAVAIRTLGFDPEPEGARYKDQYAGTTGELLAWAREKKPAAEIDADVEQYLRDMERPPLDLSRISNRERRSKTTAAR